MIVHRVGCLCAASIAGTDIHIASRIVCVRARRRTDKSIIVESVSVCKLLRKLTLRPLAYNNMDLSEYNFKYAERAKEIVQTVCSLCVLDHDTDFFFL